MKKYFLLLLLYCLPGLIRAQHSCCVVPGSATEKFANLASNMEFVNSHPVPPPIKVSLAGAPVIFQCPDGKAGGGYFVTSTKHSDRMILLFQEFWGVNDYIKSEADRISAELGVAVLAVDLYDGKVATTRENASAYMKSVTTERAQAIIKGAIGYAGEGVHIGTIGWCFGGGWSLQTAIMAGGQCDACVMYYGAPETDQAKLAMLKAPVLGIFGSKDKWLTPAVIDGFKAAMKTAKKQITVYSYDADHAFANPSNPNHDAKATAEAWKHASAFLKKELKLT
jgi:carboxymethylenebutenolidase